MQEHFGMGLNLARIKLLAFVLHILCVVQMVCLHRIASAMPTAVERIDSIDADRELVAKQWVEYFNNRRIRYYSDPRDIDHIARLTAMVCMAFAWVYMVGGHKDIDI